MKNEWRYTSILPYISMVCTHKLYFHPYRIVEKIRFNKIRNTYFTHLRVQNLLPDLENDNFSRRGGGGGETNGRGGPGNKILN
jgi:hypothetical protein